MNKKFMFIFLFSIFMTRGLQARPTIQDVREAIPTMQDVRNTITARNACRAAGAAVGIIGVFKAPDCILRYTAIGGAALGVISTGRVGAAFLATGTTLGSAFGVLICSPVGYAIYRGALGGAALGGAIAGKLYDAVARKYQA